MKGVTLIGKRSFHAVNPHARRMKEGVEESARLTEVARKRDEARRHGNLMERLCTLTRAELDAANRHLTAQMRLLDDYDRVFVSMPDTDERLTVTTLGFLARLRWALGVAWTGQFRWQREDERTTR